MRSNRIEVAESEFSENTAEVSLPEDDHVIETLPPGAAEKSLPDGVHQRRPYRCPDDPDAHSLCHPIKRGPTRFLVNQVLQAGRYLRYQVHNCDLKPSQAYLYERGIFPLGFLEVEVGRHNLNYWLLDSVESIDYKIPHLRVTKITVEIAKKGRIVGFNDPLKEITLSTEDKE